MELKQCISIIQERMGLLANSLYYSKLLWKIANKSSPSILDVGCGKGSQLVKKLRQESKRQYIVGCDGFLRYLKKNKKSKFYDDIVLADVRYLPFKEEAFSSVYCFEVIEHLPKKDGEKLLLSLEKISAEEVILSAPVGFMYQDASEGNLNHVHRSEWFPVDFKTRNYKVSGSVGPFFIKGKLKYSPLDKYALSLAELVVYTTMQPLFSKIPDVALKMICVKRINIKC